MLSHCQEYAELPVRHNEDLLNGQLAQQCRIAVNPQAGSSPTDYFVSNQRILLLGL